MLQDDPAKRIAHLIDERYPVYGLADVTVMSRDVAHETIVNEIIAALAGPLGLGPQGLGPTPDAEAAE
jgi:shikimate kinase